MITKDLENFWISHTHTHTHTQSLGLQLHLFGIQEERDSKVLKKKQNGH